MQPITEGLAWNLYLDWASDRHGLRLDGPRPTLSGLTWSWPVVGYPYHEKEGYSRGVAVLTPDGVIAVTWTGRVRT
jgi:hypothetical protein